MKFLRKLSKLKMRRKILKKNSKSKSNSFDLKCRTSQIMLESKSKRKTEHKWNNRKSLQKSDK